MQYMQNNNATQTMAHQVNALRLMLANSLIQFTRILFRGSAQKAIAERGSTKPERRQASTQDSHHEAVHPDAVDQHSQLILIRQFSGYFHRV